MDENTTRMAEQLKRNPAMLYALMQSKDGQSLLQMLTQKDNGASLQRAVQSAARGNTEEITTLVGQVMQSPDGAALIERISKTLQK